MAARHGAQRYGLTPSGAMDRLALAAANCLVGNELLAGRGRDRPLRRHFSPRARARFAWRCPARNAAQMSPDVRLRSTAR